jgi:hypothetical protein
MAGNLYSLEYIDIAEVLFSPYQVGHCFTNVLQGHSCITVATKMVEPQGCPGREEVGHGSKPLKQQVLGARPQQSKHSRKGSGW